MKLAAVSVLVAITAGLAGMSLALLLRLVQHLAFEYHSGSFLTGVEAISPDKRFLILVVCGLVSGLGWWAIYLVGEPLVRVKDAVDSQKKMPVLSSIWHVLLQITTVGMGSPLGREGAPRELAALMAQRISAKADLTPQQTRIMLACGAGAGLAAVYNVPIAGAFFALEVLLGEFSFSLLLRALFISGLAVMISWIGLGNYPAYQVPYLQISYSLILWSLIAGPILGFAGYWFKQIAIASQAQARPNWQTPVLCFINFALLGSLAIYFPALLGNGKSAAALEFNDQIGLSLTTILLALRVIITLSTLRAGAYGGLLTPSLAIGALLAVLVGGFWNLFWPGTALSAFAIVGAAAFLAAAQKMPFTAVILILEFTRINLSFLIPLILAISGAYYAANYWNRPWFSKNRYWNH
jgi:H+/Cl- antiporter ClcA